MTALVFLLMFALLPPAARAAIRLTFSDGTTTQVYYTPDSQLAIAPTSLGDYNLALDTTVSNYPGQGSLGFGSLSQTVLLGTTAGAGSAAPLTITADIIQAVGNLAAGFVTTSNVAAVINAPLLRFSAPGDMNLQVLSSGSGSTVVPNTGATIQVNTTVDGTQVTTTTDVPGGNQTLGTALNTVSGYTLTSQVVISNATRGITGLAVTATSSVTALIPEPMSLAIWCAGACGLAVALRWRRKSRVATAV
jgi:hypothetical protein